MEREEKVYFRIKSGQGYFEDITQEDGVLVGNQCKALKRTARVEEFVRAGGLVELSEGSKTVQDWLKQEDEQKRHKADTSVKDIRKNINEANDALKKYENKSQKDFIKILHQRNKYRGPENQIEYDPKAELAELISLIIQDDKEQEEGK